jgi:hypothetical protein
MNTHPYIEFQTSEIWKVIDHAIADLEENQDIQLTTTREHVVGYICKTLAEAGFPVERQRTDLNL